MFVLVSYDIVDNKRRFKVANTLKNYGTRVQYSVFECILEANRIKKMVEEVNKIIDMEKDSVRIYQLCDGCLKKTQVCGMGEITEDRDMFIV